MVEQPSTTKELGRPSDWERSPREDPLTGRFELSPVARTPVEDTVVICAGATPVCAAPRACPHKGADLVVYGRAGERPGTLGCRHADYLWDIASGDPVAQGHTGPAGQLAVSPVRVRDDGVVVTTS